MSGSGSIVAETAARIFADLGDPQSVNSAKPEDWQGPLWHALEESGLTLAWVPDDLGGAGAELADGFEVLGSAGRFAAAVPLAETLLAGWLLSRSGIASPPKPMTIAPVRPGDCLSMAADKRISGRAKAVPFASQAEHIAVLAQDTHRMNVALVEASQCSIAAGRSLAGDPLCDVRFENVKPIAVAVAPPDLDSTAVMLMGCTARSVQTAGALQAVLDMAVRYAGERVAFGRPIAKFQAVQHNLARLAGEVSAAMAASGSAADAIAHTPVLDDGVFLEAASAKIRSAEAAAEGAAIAHQVHGAIGFTKEYILHRYTLRLLAWRDDFGNESHWAVKLGHAVAKRGADGLWPLLASR